MSSELLFFISFCAIVTLVLAFDLGMFNKKDHVISYREAAAWTCVWVLLSMSAWLFLRLGGHMLHDIDSFDKLHEYVQKYEHDVRIDPASWEESIDSYREAIAIEYLTGYLVEYSLSIDNIFVIILIFSAFGVQKKLYHRVLFWGILGAVVARFIFIFGGGFLVAKYDWILYFFAAFLVYTGVRMYMTRNKKEEIDPQHHPVVRISARFFRVHPRYEGNHFFLKKDGKSYVTPLFLVLLVIEFTDIIFAVDSIPAIFAITKDMYLVFFSNIFAILGLRSMFFLLINVMDRLRFFKHGLSALLIFIGLKMFLHDWLQKIGFTSVHALLVIVSIIGLSILFSLLLPPKEQPLKH